MSIKERRDEWMRERGMPEMSPEEQLYYIRALLGLNPDQETLTGVRLIAQHGRAKFAEMRGPRYDVLNNQFADWKAWPGVSESITQHPLP